MATSLAVILLLGLPAKRIFEELRMPGLIEGLFITLVSVSFLNFSFTQSGILGFIIAAVSPAVVVPSMFELPPPTLCLEVGASCSSILPYAVLTGYPRSSYV